MAWYQVSDYVPSGGPLAAVGAGQTLQGGWIDVHGGQWTVNSSNQIIAAASSGTVWNTGELARPSSESSINSRLRVKLLATAGSYTLTNYHRWSNTGSAGNGYAIGISQTGQMQFYKNISGSISQIGSSSSFGSTAGTAYVFDTSVVQTDSATTTLSGTLYAADGTTVIGTYSVTDTTAALQNLSKPVATYQYVGTAPQAPITELTSYSDVAPTPPQPATPVTSTAFHFSPGNWKGDTGRGGSVYRQTLYCGAYFDFVFTAGSSPSASLLLASNANSLPISYFVNGALQDNVSTASLSSLALTGLVPSAVNTVRVYVRSSPSTSRWGGTNTLQIQGMTLDAGSTAGTAAAPSKWVLFNGDSINEGWVVDAGANNFLHSASFQVIETLRSQGYDVGMMAATGSGFLATGNGNVPALYSVSGGTYSDSASRWNKVDSGVSLLDTAGQISAYGVTGTPPAAILVNFGTNDAYQTVSQTDLRTSVKGVFGAYATAAPGAKIIMVPGFPLDVGNVGNAATSAAYLSTIASGFSDAVAANPSASLTYSDFGAAFGQQIYGFAANYQDGFHPTALGNAYIAPRFQGLLATALAPSAAATPPRFANTFH